MFAENSEGPKMTFEEAKQAFTKQVPVVHNCHSTGTIIKYKRIKQIIYECSVEKKVRIVLTLTTDNERCDVVANLHDVAEYDESKELTHNNYFVTV